MRKLSPKYAIILMILAAGILLPPRPSYIGDSLQYLHMAQGLPADSPFSQRPLIPFLAHNELGFRIITTLSLALTALILPTGASMLLGAHVVFFPWISPVGTDAAGLLTLALAWRYRQSILPFTLIVLIGMTIRETIIFITPLFLISTRRTIGMVPPILCSALLFALHQSTTQPLHETATQQTLHIIVAFGPFWATGILGLYLSPQTSQTTYKDQWALFALLGIGVVISTALATDTERMFLPMAIPLGIGTHHTLIWLRQAISPSLQRTLQRTLQISSPTVTRANPQTDPSATHSGPLRPSQTRLSRPDAAAPPPLRARVMNKVPTRVHTRAHIVTEATRPTGALAAHQGINETTPSNPTVSTGNPPALPCSQTTPQPAPETTTESQGSHYTENPTESQGSETT